MSCELSCRTLAGEGAHMNRKHGQFHPVRTLIDGTQCGHCLKEFFTHGKLQAHLIRSDVCRHQLVGRKIHRSPLPGLGSTQVVSQHEAWDGRLPVLQAEGPRLEPVAPRDFDEEHPQLSEDITLLIVDVTEETIQNFEDKVRSAIKRYAISWTLCRKTLSHVIALLDEADLEQTKEIVHRMRICLTSLCSPCAWPFLQQRRLQPQGPLELAQIEKDFDNAIIDPQSQEIPRPRTKERIFLHVFSGRRREGDLQFFMEKLYDQICTDSTTLCVVSVDLIIGPTVGQCPTGVNSVFLAGGGASRMGVRSLMWTPLRDVVAGPLR